MGVNAGRDFGRGLLSLSTLGLSNIQLNGSNGKAIGDTDPGRVLLAAATSGTSEIKTGGGQYGDETVADSLFPKTINDAALGGRSAARRTVDAQHKQLADQAATNAALQPDAADQALSGARRQGAMRLMTGRSRQNSFLTGGY